MEKDYYLGLDMGSGSVGWAVTDDQYHICKTSGMAGIVDCKRNLQNTENAAKESFCGSGKGKNE